MQIVNLPTKHKNFMLDIKLYQILSYRPPLSHHAIVISDGWNEDITLELSKDKLDKTVPKSTVFNGDKDFLTEVGEKQTSLYEQTDIAQRVFDNHGEYDLLSNNCQDFCNCSTYKRVLRLN